MTITRLDLTTESGDPTAVGFYIEKAKKSKEVYSFGINVYVLSSRDRNDAATEIDSPSNLRYKYFTTGINSTKNKDKDKDKGKTDTETASEAETDKE